ncbi:uncharacterized protein LOC6570385 [Drosophila grimshawi]|uniref:GH19681 n=1 Tax=Drosophila grimshawi TaxID=7222 RepID=B4K030_DROGR|nr:uncharacterized protein LOC6570385 [Drosophila grimshawi]EDV91632.1 GH19681 [Drosophila grimshawi]
MNSDGDSNKEHGDNQSLDSSFFETLWPLILDDNQCRLQSESTDYFVPSKKFDQLHWHTLLAEVGFPDYQKPHDLRCCEAAKQLDESEQHAEQEANEAALLQSAAALGDYKVAGSQAICPVDKQIEHLRQKRQRCQKLAYDFANRKYPWTMARQSHEHGFTLTTELRHHFRCPMERRILEGINQYNCKLMLIDASTDVCVDDFKRWIKFRPYAQILAIVRCPRVERHLQLLNAFNTLLVEEDIQNSWHQELQVSLHTGLKEAKRLQLLTNCAEAFVFIFSRYRGLCTCDTFTILCRT